MTLPRRLWLCVPPLIFYLADVSLTLAGQPSAYWRGNYDAVREINPLAHFLLAQALFAVGKYREAAGTTQQVLMLLPQEKWGQSISDYKKLYTNPKDYSDQLKSLAKAAADKPNDPALRFLLGFHYGYSGRVADAVRELNKLVQLEPKDQLGRKLRDLMADKTHKDNDSAIAMTPGDIYVRKDSNGTLYFTNIPAELSNQPSTWHRTQY